MGSQSIHPWVEPATPPNRSPFRGLAPCGFGIALDPGIQTRSGMRIVWALFLVGVAWGVLAAQQLPASWRLEDSPLAAYFEAEVERIESRGLAEVQTLSDWQSQREERRRQLFDMLGLWPLPPRTDLQPVITGTVDGDDFLVEKLQFQSLPGLYVTANLYRPKGLTQPAPAILYVCGHSQVKSNSVSFGNKTAYQHHGIWLARNGYVCLTIDTLQLGEIEGDHHGTYRLGQWWWNRRGYTPAGVEAWNCIRALDYLETRPEVDRTRLGMTGRSGGGSYTWTTAALDERVKVAAPVAGITDLRNQVVDGAVEGHCDCMFFRNTYRWDFAMNAALIAPRPLLLVNTDADTLFPLDGVQRLFAQTRRIYGLYSAYDRLGLVIGPGPHLDSPNLQVPVLRWFDQHLKGTSGPLEGYAEKQFTPDQLRVFTELPAESKNARIQESFGPQAPPRPTDLKELQRFLSERVFAGWPEHSGPLAVREVGREESGELRLRIVEFQSQPEVLLRLWVVDRPADSANRVRLEWLDSESWPRFQAELADRFPQSLRLREGTPGPATSWTQPAAGEVVVGFASRGWGPHAWPGDERKQTHIRRRFQLLGQTADGMRVWDLQRAWAAIRQLHPATKIQLSAEGSRAVMAALAVAGEETTGIQVIAGRLPGLREDGPDLLQLDWLGSAEDWLPLVGDRIIRRPQP